MSAIIDDKVVAGAKDPNVVKEDPILLLTVSNIFINSKIYCLGYIQIYKQFSRLDLLINISLKIITLFFFCFRSFCLFFVKVCIEVH